MKKVIITILLIVSGIHANAQIDFPSACRFIKAGNTLREAQQFEIAEHYIKKGLATVSKNPEKESRYWEAVAYEYLAMLYRDQEENRESIRNFNKALKLYRDNGYTVSQRALEILLSSVGEAEDIYGGIDIGAKGVKLSILSLKLNRNGTYEYKIIRKQTINPQTIAGTDNAFAETGAAVRELVDTLKNRGVPESRIFIIISSGLAQGLSKPDGSRLVELKRILSKNVSNYSKPIDVISAGEEGRLVTKGVLPTRFLYNSTAIDIGSGNTKGGYYTSDNRFDSLSFKYGTVTLTDAIKAQNTSNANYSEAAQAYFNATVRPLVRAELGRKAGFKNRKDVFIMGGITWALITYLHPEKVKESFVTFTVDDVKKLKKMAIENYDALIHPDLSSLEYDPELRAAAEVDVKDARDKVFNQENIIAGATLLEEIMKEIGSTKIYHFPRYGVVGWITGYVAESVTEEFKNKTE